MLASEIWMLFLSGLGSRVRDSSMRRGTIAFDPAPGCLSSVFQVRAFAKEAALLGNYEGAQRQTLRYGLRSAKLDGAFMATNSSLATGEEWGLSLDRVSWPVAAFRQAGRRLHGDQLLAGHWQLLL